MTSRTRLPTVWPTRPVSQPLMTWPSPITVVSGVLRAQEESKTLPVRQITPVYWTAMSWPAFTTAPVPLIRGLTWRVFGAGVRRGGGHGGQRPSAVGRLRTRDAPGGEGRADVDDEHQRVAGADALGGVARRAEAVLGRDHREHPAAQLLADKRRLKPWEQRPDEDRRGPLGVGGAEELAGLAGPVVGDVVADHALRGRQLRAGPLDDGLG